MVNKEKLAELAKLVRYYILRMTTKAGSGHATSALSATDIMVALFFNVLRFDLDHPDNPNNDRVIFSKGHASPLLYALYAAAGVISEKELDTYRQFQSPLEGHPTPRFKYVEVATGSLGQGLSIGVGMALALRIQGSTLKRVQGATLNSLPKVYVLMGDSEVSEGSVWEAMEIASYYYRRSLSANKEASDESSLRSSSLGKLGTAGLKLGNLVGIIDVNRLGQSGETMLGWDFDAYKSRVESFGWKAHLVDGHDFREIVKVFDKLPQKSDQAQMIIAKTIKGKGVSFLEDKEGWHGKALSEEQYREALKELGEIDKRVKGVIEKPEGSLGKGKEASVVRGLGHKFQTTNLTSKPNWLRNPNLTTTYRLGEMVATRKAYGEAIARLGEIDKRIVCLDAEVKNSTFAEIFKEKIPERFFEMFIAEQNMVGVALGMSKRGYIPFVSTFAAFLTRAFDQIRMSAYSGANVKFMGSHTGVSIGEDGPSQMGLEDIAMFRAVFGSIIFCPADAVSCAKLVRIAAETDGLFYIRTARPATPTIYMEGEEFSIGGSRVIKSSNKDRLTIVACGVTVAEAIKAAGELARQGINVRVVDAYSIKPIDEATLEKAAGEAGNTIVTVEDHYFEGGLGDAVLNVFSDGSAKVHKLAVWQMPRSGKGDLLMEFEGISAKSIVGKVIEVLG